MLNHVKKGLERTYDRYDLEEEKRSSFLSWEAEIAGIARSAGVAEALGAPPPVAYARPQRLDPGPVLAGRALQQKPEQKSGHGSMRPKLELVVSN